MARARNIKPGFFSNDELVELPFEYRLLFIGLWTVADRDGRLLDRHKKIKMDIFPADNVDVDAGLVQLAERGFILRYEIGGLKCIQITTWHKHQNPHIKEAPSTIPAPDERRGTASEPTPEPSANAVNTGNDGASTLPTPDEHHASTMQAPEIPERARLIPDSLNLIPDSGYLIPDTPNPAVPAEGATERRGFDRFWLAYPKKVGKGDAEKSFKRISPDAALLAKILAAIDAAKQGADWHRNAGQYIPNPATWLNGKRWEDEIQPLHHDPPNRDAERRSRPEKFDPVAYVNRNRIPQ